MSVWRWQGAGLRLLHRGHAAVRLPAGAARQVEGVEDARGRGQLHEDHTHQRHSRHG